MTLPFAYIAAVNNTGHFLYLFVEFVIILKRDNCRAMAERLKLLNKNFENVQEARGIPNVVHICAKNYNLCINV